MLRCLPHALGKSADNKSPGLDFERIMDDSSKMNNMIKITNELLTEM